MKRVQTPRVKMDKMLLTILSPFLTKNNSHETSANVYSQPMLQEFCGKESSTLSWKCFNYSIIHVTYNIIEQKCITERDNCFE